jgi:Lhr-like helicase
MCNNILPSTIEIRTESSAFVCKQRTHRETGFVQGDLASVNSTGDLVLVIHIPADLNTIIQLGRSPTVKRRLQHLVVDIQTHSGARS